MGISANESSVQGRKIQTPYQKAWYLKFNDPQSQRALWLRFTLLASNNGFTRVAETWAIFFQRNPNREVTKVALKQSYGIDAFSESDSSTIQIGDCFVSKDRTAGKIQSKGQTLQWDLSLVQTRPSSFSFVPEILARSGLIRNSVVTTHEDLLFSGSTKINDETIHWKEALGMRGRVFGSKSGHSWVWGHCNTFVNESGKPVNFVFEGLSARAQVGPFVTPQLSSFFFRYQDQIYAFNTLKDAVFLRSKNTLNEWEFRADQKEISFRGYAKAEHKDFAGLTFEDTNGSLLYCSNSKLSDLKVLVYNRGKLESTLVAPGTAAFEVVSRKKSPYVSLLI